MQVIQKIKNKKCNKPSRNSSFGVFFLRSFIFFFCFHQTNHFHQYKLAIGQRCRTSGELARFEFRGKWFSGSLNVKFSQIKLISIFSPSIQQVTSSAIESDSAARKLKISLVKDLENSVEHFWLSIKLLISDEKSENSSMKNYVFVYDPAFEWVRMSLIHIEWNIRVW